MEIKINGQSAVLKRGTSFEYVAENRLFSGSDGYTLSITFPLKDCQRNTAIFGNINRSDVIAGRVIFDCEIRHGKFFKFGSITVNQINDSEVKCQFLEGRSEQNFDSTFDDIYINELSLGTWPSGKPSPAQAWQPVYYPDCVALPWVNDNTGNIQNCADYKVDDAVQNKGHFEWNADTRGLSWQPYLLFITKKICEAVGYEADFSKWEAVSEYRYLLICNTLPWAWDLNEFARALPHWSVSEYFEKLELFLGGEFAINHRARSIDFAFTADLLKQTAPVQLANVVNDHSVEVTVEDDAKCEYLGAKNIVYKECDHEMWKFYSCDWFMRSQRFGIVEYDTMAELLSANRWLRTTTNGIGRGNNASRVLHAKDIDVYFLVRAVRKELMEKRGGFMPNRYRVYYKLQPVNLFGGRIVDAREDAEQTEIEFVPAWIDETDETYGRLLFLPFSGYDEDDPDSGRSSHRDPYERKAEIDATLYQPWPVQSLEQGESEKKSEYYDRIYVAFWDGANNVEPQLPYPEVENVVVSDDWQNFRFGHFSLRINDRAAPSAHQYASVDPKKKTTFKFIADSIPDVRAVFNIHGKNYVCEKITATFTESGMSQLMKGVFYPCIQDIK